MTYCNVDWAMMNKLLNVALYNLPVVPLPKVLLRFEGCTCSGIQTARST